MPRQRSTQATAPRSPPAVIVFPVSWYGMSPATAPGNGVSASLTGSSTASRCETHPSAARRWDRTWGSCSGGGRRRTRRRRRRGGRPPRR
uniref:Uncharacterized protein n=1 Tax=Arundo donax TaxID=35708 RepID=A0A0A8XZB0_ARUDO